MSGWRHSGDLSFQYPCFPLARGERMREWGGFQLLAAFVEFGAAIGTIPIAEPKFTKSW